MTDDTDLTRYRGVLNEWPGKIPVNQSPHKYPAEKEVLKEGHSGTLAIIDAQQLEMELEKKILSLLREFENKTGTQVFSIDVYGSETGIENVRVFAIL